MPIKGRDCGTCKYDLWGPYCLEQRNCDKCERKESDTGLCLCISVDYGTECPYYKPKEE